VPNWNSIRDFFLLGALHWVAISLYSFFCSAFLVSIVADRSKLDTFFRIGAFFLDSVPPMCCWQWLKNFDLPVFHFRVIDY
jgi:hypothetical protein